MKELAAEPAFAIYALCAVILCLNMLGLWGFSGGVRTKSKATPNKEDADKGGKLTAEGEEPPELARVLRVHRNAVYNILPFLVLGLLYCINGASARAAWILFGGFTVVRLLHTFSYLRGLQPWRTIFFTLGGLITLGLMVQVVRGSLPHLM